MEIVETLREALFLTKRWDKGSSLQWTRFQDLGRGLESCFILLLILLIKHPPPRLRNLQETVETFFSISTFSFKLHYYKV